MDSHMLHLYIHTFTYRYIHTYIHTYLPTYLPTYPPTYLPTCVGIYIFFTESCIHMTSMILMMRNVGSHGILGHPKCALGAVPGGTMQATDKDMPQRIEVRRRGDGE